MLIDISSTPSLLTWCRYGCLRSCNICTSPRTASRTSFQLRLRLWGSARPSHCKYCKFPTLIETNMTSVLTCPPYIIAGFISIVWAWSSGRRNERTWHITIAKSVAVVGFITGCATLNTGAKYFAMVLFAIGVYATNSIVLGWVSATCGQTKEKKSCSLAIVNTIANVAFIWTPVRNLSPMSMKYQR